MVKATFFALMILALVCVLLFGATTMTNGGVVFKTFATHPDTPPAGGTLMWAKTDGTMQLTNSSAVDSGMGGGAGAAQVLGAGSTGAASGVQLPTGGELYGPPIGVITLGSTYEAVMALPLSRVGTLSNLCGGIGIFGQGDGALVFTLRKNTADTTLVATVPASGAAGFYCDTTHTVSVTATDLISVHIVNQASGTSTFIVGYTFLFQ